MTNVVYNRLCSLDEFLLKEFYSADVATSKFILVYAIAKTDALFFDFLFEKFRDALMNPERQYLSIDDFDSFFESKKQEWKNRKKYKYFKCPKCGQRMRAPRHKGKIRVTCNQCTNVFLTKT